MPHPARDPQTGKFVSAGGATKYDDIEVATFQADFGTAAANLSGGTGFGGSGSELIEGATIIDFDDFVDRNEELRLLAAWHRLSVWVNSTQTADGTVRMVAEISASPSLTVPTSVNTTDELDADTQGDPVGDVFSDDTIDVIGRPLSAIGYGPITDGTNGVGGAGSAGEDQYELPAPPAEMGKFHPRDELFLNVDYEEWNVDDAGAHGELSGQHWYGVIES